SSVRSCRRDAPTTGTTRSALGDRPVIPTRRPDVELPRPPDAGARIRDHLPPMRDPADAAGDREHHREHRLRDAERAVDDSRVEVDVRIQVLLDEVLVAERDLLEPQRELEERRIEA